jgi:hypothetical protein
VRNAGVTSSSTGGGSGSGPVGVPALPPAPTSMGVPLPVLTSGPSPNVPAAPGASAGATGRLGFAGGAALVSAFPGARGPGALALT